MLLPYSRFPLQETVKRSRMAFLEKHIKMRRLQGQVKLLRLPSNKNLRTKGDTITEFFSDSSNYLIFPIIKRHLKQ